MAQCIAISCDSVDADVPFPVDKKRRNHWLRNLGFFRSSNIIIRDGNVFLKGKEKPAMVCWRHFEPGSLRRRSINQYSFMYDDMDAIHGTPLIPTLSSQQAKTQKTPIIHSVEPVRVKKRQERNKLRARLNSAQRSKKYRQSKRQRTFLGNLEIQDLQSLVQPQTLESTIDAQEDVQTHIEDLVAASETTGKQSISAKNKLDTLYFSNRAGGPVLSWASIIDAPNPVIAHFTCFPSRQALLEFYELLNFQQAMQKWDAKKPALPSRDALILLLYVLRTGSSLLDASFQFGVPYSTCCRTFSSFLQIVAAFLDTISPTPTKETFEKLEKKLNANANLRATHIIDTSSVEIQTPSSLSRQSCTYSKYYNCNCAKFLVCLSSAGHIVYVSRAYPGRISDTQLCSMGFYSFLKSSYPNATVLADKGFFIHFALAVSGATLILPSPRDSEKKFTEDEIIHTKVVANERIFIEHVVGAMKNEFKILSGKIPLLQVDLLDLMLKVVCHLINLIREPFVPKKCKVFMNRPCAHEIVHNPDFFEEPATASSFDPQTADPSVLNQNTSDIVDISSDELDY